MFLLSRAGSSLPGRVLSRCVGGGSGSCRVKSRLFPWSAFGSAGGDYRMYGSVKIKGDIMTEREMLKHLVQALDQQSEW